MLILWRRQWNIELTRQFLIAGIFSSGTNMQNTVLSLALLGILSGCVTSGNGTDQPDRSRYSHLNPTPQQEKFFADYERGMKKMLTPELKKQCVDNFKRKAHDPASVQIAGDWGVDTLERASLWRGDDEYARISVPVRAKNGYGGLRLGRLYCYYDLRTDNTLAFNMSLAR